ncbi:MAG TPA: hypothetical protein PKW95_22250 [bacterium]|nr:hypothetical protein [bacterium]
MKRTIALIIFVTLLYGLATADDPPRRRGDFSVFHGFTADGAQALFALHDREQGLREYLVLAVADGEEAERLTPAQAGEIAPGRATRPSLPAALADRFVQPGVQNDLAPHGRALLYSHITHDKERDMQSAFRFRLAALRVVYHLRHGATDRALAVLEVRTAARAEQPVDVTQILWTPDGKAFAVAGYLHAADPAPGLSVDRAVTLAGRLEGNGAPLPKAELGEFFYKLGDGYYDERLYWDAAANLERAATLAHKMEQSRWLAARSYALMREKDRCLQQLDLLAALHSGAALKLLLKVKKHKDFESLRTDPDFMTRYAALVDGFAR